MSEEATVQEYLPQEQYDVEIRARIEAACDRVNCETKNYLTAQKVAVKMAAAGFEKAKTPEERKYYMDIVNDTKKEEQQNIYYVVGAGCGVAALYIVYRIVRLIVLKR